MKKLVLVALLLSACFSLQAQNYFPFAEENKIWAEIGESWGNLWTTYYKLQGDTLLNGKSYKVIYSSTDSLMQTWARNATEFIRLDTNQKVYKLRWDGEVLIYDFSLETGDSVDISHAFGSGVFARVDSTDSVMINGQYRKRIIFDSWFNEIWIEGIGSLSSPFNPFCNFMIADLYFHLLCVTRNDTLIFHDPVHSDCWYQISDVREIDAQKDPKITVYPMPVIGSATVMIKNNQGEFHTAKLINNLGQFIATYTVNGDSFVLNSNGMSPGFYSLILLGDHSFKNCKIMIRE